MSFLNPTWFWGLLALSIPLAIHLLSRKEGRVLRVGSLRFLQDSPTRQFKSIRLNELFLLALRMLLIVLLVGFLTQWLIPDSSRKPWVLTDEPTMSNPLAKPLIDSLTRNGYEWRLFTKDFPLHDPSQKFPPCLAWSLVNDLKGKSFSTAIILSNSRITNFAGRRPALPPGVSWINIPEEADRFLLSARYDGDSIKLRVGTTMATETSYRYISELNKGETYYKLENDSLPIASHDTLRIFIQAEKGFEHDESLLRAALKAINDSGHLLEVVSYPASGSPKSMDWLVWLSEKPVPQLPATNHLIHYGPSAHALLVHQQQYVWTISNRLTEERCLEEQFTLQLMTVLFAPDNESVSVASMNDRRVLPEKLMWTPEGSNDQAIGIQEKTASLIAADAYVILLILIVWMVERWVSYRRNQ